MNKKGFAITGMLLMLILLIIGVIAFFSSTVMRFTIIGIGLVVFAGVMVFKTQREGLENKKLGFFIMIFIVGILITIIPYTGLLQMTAFESELFEAPFFATIHCDESGAIITGNDIPLSDSYTDIRCPVNTVGCDVWINIDGNTILPWQDRYARYKICDSSGSNCDNKDRIEKIVQVASRPQPSYTFQLWDDLQNNKMIKVKVEECLTPLGPCSVDENIDWKVNMEYNPYILWVKDSLAGGERVLTSNQQDCKINTRSESWLERIVSTDITENEDGTEVQEAPDILVSGQLRPGQRYNYVSGTVTRALAGNSITYNGDLSYCLENPQGTDNSYIYPINTIETSTTKYRMVNLNAEPIEVDCCVESRIQLNRICKDLKWEQVEIDENTNCIIGSSCPCDPGRITYRESSSYKYSCENELCCIRDIREEECNDNSDCKTTEICVNFKCIDPSTDEGGKGGKDISNEQNCLAENKEGSLRYQWVEKETESGFLFFKKTTTEPYCKDTYMPYIIAGIIGIVLIVIIVMFIILMRNPKKKKRSKK